VRNELRELEKQRVKIVQETEIHKASLYKLQDHISDAKKQLQIAQADLAKVSHELYTATKSSLISVVSEKPPIVIFREIPLDGFVIRNDRSNRSVVPSQCSGNPNACLNHQKCKLTDHFKVFLYPFNRNKHSQEVLTAFEDYLRSIDALTDSPDEACIFVAIYDSGQFDPNSLPHWKDGGTNHILINMANDSFHQLNPLKATLVQSLPSTHWRDGYDILIPPPLISTIHSHHHYTTSPHVPAFRKFLLYFQGISSRQELTNYNTWLHHFSSTISLNETIHIQTDCGLYNSKVVEIDGWGLCGDEYDRSQLLSQSTFSLILSTSGQTTLSNQVRLYEGLKYGAIPVIVGSMGMAYDSVLDWTQVSIQLPLERLHELHYIIRSISHDKILELRRLGKFIWDTYFSSPIQILKSVIAIIRYRMSHLPPVAKDVKNVRIKTYNKDSPAYKSPIFTSNSSIYNYELWNRPPGPFLMYPHTPHTPPPVSGSQYTFPGVSSKLLKELPPRILKAGSITGTNFRQYLYGNVPDEYFTVIMLAYDRIYSVTSAITRLQYVPNIAKIIIVWNDLNTSPYKIEWPNAKIQVEVIWADKNSLNNRFIPYDVIETDAILSIDDDVELEVDEIQLAFRVWRESRDRLVGFPGRFHSYDFYHHFWMYKPDYTCEISMVLTGAAFYHKYYSYLYTSWQPQEVRDMIDEYMNCEDIAMNFLISHITRKPPLKVGARMTFPCYGCHTSLSKNPNHYLKRDKCVDRLVKIYGYMPLLYTQYRADSMLYETDKPKDKKCFYHV
jgi:alpha-1,4-N-acetylglucosaminyltransferase EXTL3